MALCLHLSELLAELGDSEYNQASFALFVYPKAQNLMESTISVSMPENQIIVLAQQLTPKGKQALLQHLIPEMEMLDRLVDYGEQRIRAISTSRGVEWDTLSEDDRMAMVDELMHENSHG